jgi:hypothetical protein
MTHAAAPTALREAILESLPTDVFVASDPDPRFLYLPTSHIRALDPDSMLVVGARGTGKSFWWYALQNPETRRIVSDLFPSRTHAQLQVVGGWGQNSRPGKDVLPSLLSKDARLVWKTIVLERLAPDFFQADTEWTGRLARVLNDAEAVERRLASIDEELLNARTRKLVLFDALDLVADTWADRNSLLKGLFKLLLEFRYTRSIRLKAFVRADVVEDPAMLGFPDASKLLHAQVELTWSKVDLYGLLWQHMGNAGRSGEVVRGLLKGWTGDSTRWELPAKLAKDADTQKKLFTVLAGEKMGGGIKRGLPYQWVPNHLADSRGQTTPRSFLAAMRTAAEQTPAAHQLALDWRAIQQGVAQASNIRVRELNEDFEWMDQVMKPLEGSITVPCESRAILDRWRRQKVLERIRAANPGELPPRCEEGEQGLLLELEKLGVLHRREDGRINVPDVYRIKFGIKRRGGVPPIR